MEKKNLKIIIDQLERVHRDMNDCANKYILKDAIEQLQKQQLNAEKVKLDKWEALIFYDKNEDCYTVCWTGKGGAIISNNDKDKAIEMWIKKMKLADSVKNNFL